ncbi:uncharacterized protein LOC133910479 [Phragmites australis]|uniref:uncharacterized protein LOC133910479 n=1 Tax=Phragmites australis TaxID=29695 RepID=UPI002D77A6A6|nr:uncharacterized protein LOC133910479 [Phragmites australis]
MNMTAVRRKRKLSRQLPLPRLLAVAFAFAGTLLFLAIVLLSTSPPSPSPHRHIVATGFSSSRRPPPCGAVSLGELGDMMVSMVPKGLPFTVFVPSTESFLRVLKLRPNGSGAAEGETASDTSTYAVLSRVLGFSAVPRRVLSADVPPRGAVRLLDSVSGLRIYASRDASGALVVNGVRSECVDIVRGEAVVHVMAGVLMDADFERSSSPEFGDYSWTVRYVRHFCSCFMQQAQL